MSNVRNSIWNGIWTHGLLLAVVLLSWEMGSKAGVIPANILPAPGEIGGALIRSVREDALLGAVGDSMKLMLIGYVMSVILGVPLGAVIYQIPVLRRTLGAALLGLQTLPSVCWLPLALLWFGGSINAVLFVVLANSTFSIATATSGALAQVPPLFIQAGQTLGARGWSLSLRVLFPGALPGIVTGLRIGWTFAWRALMAGELIYPHAGLGRLLQQGRTRGDIAEILATMLFIMVLGLLVEVVFFSRVDNVLRRKWGLEPV